MQGLRIRSCIQQSLPSGVIRQVAAGHAFETDEPALEAAMPSVDVLDVDRTACAPAGPDINGLMRDAGVGGKPGIGRSAVADEQPVAGQHLLQASA